VWETSSLATVGGTFLDTGITGLLLGGGFGFLSPKYGLACDNVLAYDFVSVHGEYARITDQSNPKLFRALKGASSIVRNQPIAAIRRSNHY
jgi:FAD/FMN-containing dehydrogenase